MGPVEPFWHNDTEYDEVIKITIAIVQVVALFEGNVVDAHLMRSPDSPITVTTFSFIGVLLIEYTKVGVKFGMVTCLSD